MLNPYDMTQSHQANARLHLLVRAVFLFGMTFKLDCMDVFLFCAEMQHIFTPSSSGSCYPYRRPYDVTI